MAVARRLLLFVCTGNICRSPMAEYLLRHELRRQRGWTVASAGLHAGTGLPASPAAIQVLRRLGIDLRLHRSRMLSAALVDAATLIVVMTCAHREQMQALFPGAGDKLYLLKTFDPQAADQDVNDPIGLPARVYAETCAEIRAALPGLMRYLETFAPAGEQKP